MLPDMPITMQEHITCNHLAQSHCESLKTQIWVRLLLLLLLLLLQQQLLLMLLLLPL